MIFEKGFTLATRPGARALVARGSETISVGPNTSFALSKHRSRNGKTTLLQRSGTIEVDVQKRQRPHFTVETPFLAAVVKGTQFKVSIRGKKASVSVSRGLVGVEDFASGDRVDLSAGQSATSAPTSSPGLTVTGRTKPVVRPGSKRPPAFETPATKNVPSINSQADGSAVSNSAGNSNSGQGNNNAGGNGNSNAGRGNNNAGGNGNGNSGGNGNSNSGSGNNNAGGNGNGNSGGNGNSNSGSGNNNAGGNGNGNSGGNGNSNSGSGNNNAGGNGNGNSGGNGKN
ncbi:MAG: FecR family protein [Roseibium sp.]